MIRVAEPLTGLAHDLLEQRTTFPVEGDDARGSILVVGGSAGSGANFDVVPGSAWFLVDRRFNPEEELDEELARLTDSIARAATDAGGDVTVDVLQRAPSASTDDATRRRGPSPTHRADRRQSSAVRALPGQLETRW